ncbi:nasal embryonic LHRH factor, isoform CRA_c, partial [Mus musculus]
KGGDSGNGTLTTTASPCVPAQAAAGRTSAGPAKAGQEAARAPKSAQDVPSWSLVPLLGPLGWSSHLYLRLLAATRSWKGCIALMECLMMSPSVPGSPRKTFSASRRQPQLCKRENFRKHLRMVGSRRVKAQTFAERRERSFSRSWSDPTPMKADTSHDSRDSSDLQSSHCTLDEACEDLDWDTEKGLEAMACNTEGFLPPKVMLISSKVPKAEYIPTIIRRDDPSIIPILYDHEHATFEDILEEIEKKLNIYHKGAKIWKMLIFCQGGPGHLYLLKNKVATFAKVEKEEDMIHFWKRLSRLMSKVNPEPNVIHIMGCYILGNPNGEKLFQNLRTLMTPYKVTFESPLELSAQGKQMIETYFDFRLYRLWKSRQHSKLLDFDDVL